MVLYENKRILIEGEAKVRNLDKENVLVDNKENKEQALQDALTDINIDKMTPLEALDILDKLKKKHGI